MDKSLTNQELDNFLEQLRKDSPIKSHLFNTTAAYNLIKRGFAKKENIQANGVYDLVITEHGRSFIGFCKEHEKTMRETRRDELNERTVKSAEIAAKAANRANTISIWAIVISIISIILSLIHSFVY